MGLFKKLSVFFQRKPKIRILIVGLDNGGKTTILNLLKNDYSQKIVSLNAVPTVGFHTEEIAKENAILSCVDVSGQRKYRHLWHYFLHEMNAIVFVLDASDPLRFVVVRDELQTLLSHEVDNRYVQEVGENLTFVMKFHMSWGVFGLPFGNCLLFPELRQKPHVPILFLANKMDLSNSASVHECCEALHVSDLQERSWNIEGTNAFTGEGIEKGLEWLIHTAIIAKKDDQLLRGS